MDETWLYHYNPETKQQSMEWRHSGSPHPKKLRVQKSGGKLLASIFWDQDGILLIIFQRAKLSARSITNFCWCKWRTFWRKTVAGSSPRWSCSCTTMPQLTQKKLAYLGFQFLDHPPYSPDLAPSDYHLFPGLKKNNWKFTIFRPTRKSLLPRWSGWTDKLLNFSVWLAN